MLLICPAKFAHKDYLEGLGGACLNGKFGNLTAPVICAQFFLGLLQAGIPSPYFTFLIFYHIFFLYQGLFCCRNMQKKQTHKRLPFLSDFSKLTPAEPIPGRTFLPGRFGSKSL